MDWILLIPLMPIAVFVLFLFLPRSVRNKLLWLSTAVMGASAVLSVMALVRLPAPGGEEAAHGAEAVEALWHLAWPLARVSGRTLELSMGLDAFAALTLVAVAVVATCVQVFSLSYMREDVRRGWYYAVLSLFTSAMFVLVLSGNLLLTFAMWELMGLCSYLLIGFWYEQEGPRKASQKAFLTTRVGDLGFVVALAAIYGVTGTFDLAMVVSRAPGWSPEIATTVSFGLLWAAMGKSAQLPLHVWLPDAMAGPTPASALIHAATMVAAGVFVVARTLPLFTEAALGAMLVIGLLTALAAGLMAAVQYDIKKVLAYSTISQLGLMFIALGAGSAVAAMFHLTTHAFFKSLLFLGSGSIIHATHTQDMRHMGGLARSMPRTTAVFTVGTLALAGMPPLAGFFSKDEILVVLEHDHQTVAFYLVILASVLTAFYMTRLWFRVFAGPAQNEHVHDADALTFLPMLLLAGVTAVVGFFGPRFGEMMGHEIASPGLEMWLMSLGISGLGIAIGWWFYGRRGRTVDTDVVRARLGILHGMLVQKLYFDLTYDFFLIRGYFHVARLASAFDAAVVDGVVNGAGRAWRRIGDGTWRFDAVVVDGAVNGLGSLTRGVGGLLRKLQTGKLQTYQRLVLGATVILMVVLVVLKGA